VSGSFITQDNVSQEQVIQVQMRSLEDIITQLGHQQVDILKMDIEGAEYQVLESVLKNSSVINQILIEFHDRFFKDGKQRTIYAINKLKEHGFEIFGVSDSLEEISFINKRLL
jgi:hypothetical protein